MKEYKIIERNFWKDDKVLEDTINQYAREGWKVTSAIGNQGGRLTKVILERDKYR
ncbi:MAG: DUF4177 domain-containing protein [Flavobacteriaceae bacterium]|nr:DUF4177 domain-containing protein [Flavobacteriaceae bacterium]